MWEVHRHEDPWLYNVIASRTHTRTLVVGDMTDVIAQQVLATKADGAANDAKEKMATLTQRDVVEEEDAGEQGLSETEKASKFRIKNIARYLALGTGAAFIVLGIIGAITKDGGARVAAGFTIAFSLPFFLVELSYYDVIPVVRTVCALPGLRHMYEYFLVRAAAYVVLTLPTWFNTWTMPAGFAAMGTALAYGAAKLKGEKVRAWKTNDPSHDGTELEGGKKARKKKQGHNARANVKSKKSSKKDKTTALPV